MNHGAILRRVMREVLEPAGLIRPAGSRYWVDDHGWWLAALWFEPSDFDRGTYLRASRMYLWVDRGHLAFDEDVVDRWPVGGRLTAWVPALDATVWERDVRDLAAASVAFVEEVRRERADLHAAIGRLGRRDRDAWTEFHMGIAQGLLGDAGAARASLERVASSANPYAAPWLEDLRLRAADMAARLGDEADFRNEVTATILRARERLRLPNLSLETIEPH